MKSQCHSELPYIHRPYMNKGKFKAKGIDYEIVEGIFMCKDNKEVHGIRFKNIETKQTTIMSESDFFLKGLLKYRLHS